MPTIRSKFILLALAAGIPLAAAAAAGTHPAAPSGADPLAAGEQTAAAAPSLAALQTRARERSPRLAELAARLAAAREEIAPAGALADPMVEVRLQNMGLDRWSVGSEPMSMLETGVRQGLPYPGKRAARRAAAAAEAETLAAELAASEREIAREVAALYARLFALDRERLLVEQAGELVDLLLATLTSRYAAGEEDQAALLAVQLERTGLAERQVEVAGERAEAEGLLRGLLDLPPGTPIGPVEELPALAPLPAGIAEAAARLAPEVAVRRAEAEIARRGEELARLDLKPDFSLAAGLGWRGDDDPALM
ncbi:MAG: TolC family protein, partial [Thermoanaerobaculia bacterium]|nr:TolC family protein [Thermoanaerobaculia bacterium]